MKKSALLRLFLVGALALTGLFGFVSASFAGDVNDPCQSNNNADADDDSTATATDNNNCSNSGDADAAADQAGTATSGDGVAGQVAGVVSAGDASVDATNRSDDVSVATGDANGTNDANLDVRAGIAFLLPDGAAGDETQGSNCRNVGGVHTANEGESSASGSASQANAGNCFNDGDADGAIGQAADAASGDGVGGQVIGVVTSAGGSADLVLDNESSDSEVESGDGDFSNTADEFTDAGVFFTIAPD
jgi:hypothetical protein